MRARFVRRNSILRSEADPNKAFKRLGLKRSDCHGNVAGHRTQDVLVSNVRGSVHAVVMRHPTKRRTKGRICWATFQTQAAA